MKKTHGLVICAILLSTTALAQLSGPGGRVGVDEKLGDIVPIHELMFRDEAGQEISLGSLFDRPVLLTPVYFRCPSICTPTLQEVARAADECDLVPGVDYRIVTFSFSQAEGPDLAAIKQENMLLEFKTKTVAPDAWRFLTSDQETIERLTSAIGFLYTNDQNQVDFVHTSSVLFLSKEGKIVRYLDGLKIKPADLKLSVFDASAGIPRPVIQRLQSMCYSFDPTEQTYVVRVNRIIFTVTLGFVLVFATFLVIGHLRVHRRVSALPDTTQHKEEPA